MTRLIQILCMLQYETGKSTGTDFTTKWQMKAPTSSPTTATDCSTETDWLETKRLYRRYWL